MGGYAAGEKGWPVVIARGRNVARGYGQLHEGTPFIADSQRVGGHFRRRYANRSAQPIVVSHVGVGRGKKATDVCREPCNDQLCGREGYDSSVVRGGVKAGVLGLSTE